MIRIRIFTNNTIVKFYHIGLISNKYTINLINNKYKNEINEIQIKLQSGDLYFALYSDKKSCIYFNKYIINKYGKKETNKLLSYDTKINIKVYINYLGYYLIYIIKKYYSIKHKTYCSCFDSMELYKKFNTMSLYKIVALI